MIPDRDRCRLIRYDGGRMGGRYILLPLNPILWGLSPYAALAYGLMLDRTRLSRRNGWTDELGQPYIRYSRAALSRDMGACLSTVKRAIRELEENGLLRRETARGRADRLYLMALPPLETAPPSSLPVAAAGAVDTGDLDWLLEQASPAGGIDADGGQFHP